MAKYKSVVPLTTAEDRFQVRIEKNDRNQVRYIIVDTDQDPEEPFAAVIPENHKKPNYQQSRERKAYALCDELNDYDKSPEV